MILLLAGTKEGREIGEQVVNQGYDLIATAVSNYGAELLKESQIKEILAKALQEEDLLALIVEKDIKVVIDATHPYAKVVSDTAFKVCKRLNLPYIRYQRASIAPDKVYDNLIKVRDFSEAAEKLELYGKRVFLTIGSKNLKIFVEKTRQTGQELIARVLPDPTVLAECYQMGLRPKNIIALQGPFSLEMNRLMFLETSADVIVTKDSGLVGGTDTKLLAAKELNLPVILVQRPEIEGLPGVGYEVDSSEEILKVLSKIY